MIHEKALSNGESFSLQVPSGVNYEYTIEGNYYSVSKTMGADIEATEDGMIINGRKPLHGAVIDSKLDRRIAMSFAIAGLVADGETTILNSECVDISYPDFYKDLNGLMK